MRYYLFRESVGFVIKAEGGFKLFGAFLSRIKLGLFSCDRLEPSRFPQLSRLSPSVLHRCSHRS